MVSTAFPTSPSFITSAHNCPSEPSSRISGTERVSALFAIGYRSTPRWGSPLPVESLWAHAPEISISGFLSIFFARSNWWADEMEDLINHQSGLFALSSGESDMKSLLKIAPALGIRRHMLALNVFVISVRKAIGAYIALLGGGDILVFTGGIGEHSYYVRSSSYKRPRFSRPHCRQNQDCPRTGRTADRAPLPENARANPIEEASGAEQ